MMIQDEIMKMIFVLTVILYLIGKIVQPIEVEFPMGIQDTVRNDTQSETSILKCDFNRFLNSYVHAADLMLFGRLFQSCAPLTENDSRRMLVFGLG